MAVDPVADDGAGAAGVARVPAFEGAGVEGGLLEDAAEAVDAGGGLGLKSSVWDCLLTVEFANLRNHAHDESFLFDLVRLNSISILENLA